MRKGFTLLELVIVIIILGILVSVGLATYSNMRERAVRAEAKANLGALRTLQAANFAEFGVYSTVLGTATGNLPIILPTDCPSSTHYFEYDCAATGTCTATRCAASKTPTTTASYSLSLDINGIPGGSW